MPRATHTLRIIAGTLRRRHVRFVAQPALRPTPDRVRETVFNWLGPSVVGARCLDLFSGSGILGLEALSRGAACCTWVENDPASIACLREHIALFHLEEQADLKRSDVSVFLKGRVKQPYNVVFLDPPYRKNWLLSVLPQLKQHAWLAPQAWVYVEHEQDLKIVWPAFLKEHRRCQAGQVQGVLLQACAEEA